MEHHSPSVLMLDPDATDPELAEVVGAAGELLPGARVTRGDGWAAIPLGDGVRPVDGRGFERLPSVRRLIAVSAPYRLASRELFDRDVAVEVPLRGANRQATTSTFGGGGPLGVIATSQWASANESRFEHLAPLLREAGCSVFHVGEMALPAADGASVGLAESSVRSLGAIANDHGLASCVEVSDASQIASAAAVADVLQVGSRNMQDFSLLREMGATEQPVLLRRGVGATVEEFLLAAEYVLAHGNGRVILCESGIRTFDALEKPRFEINAVPLIKQLSHLPLVADPSQTAPHTSTIPGIAKAAVAAGADGLVLDVGAEGTHETDAAIDIETMRKLMDELQPIARAAGRAGRVWNGARAVQEAVR